MTFLTSEQIGKSVGARLRELRVDAELTQAQVAALTGIHRPIICRIERGVHVPTLDVVRRYAEALGVDTLTVLLPCFRALEAA